MSLDIDYYEVLGIELAATQIDIKRAYRRLAMQYHPDYHPDSPQAAEMFRRIQEAYEVLSHPDKRKSYDLSLRSGAVPREAKAQQRQDAKSARKGRGADLRYNLSLTLEEAHRGCLKTLEFDRMRGSRLDHARLDVQIPPGVMSSQRLKIKGQGDLPDGVGATPGDLYVLIRHEPHPIFKLYDDEIHLEVYLPFTHAILGVDMMLPTLEGSTRFQLPAGTSGGQIVRLKGLGFQVFGTGERGDMMVRVAVEVPKHLEAHQLEQIKNLSATVNKCPRYLAQQKLFKELQS